MGTRCTPWDSTRFTSSPFICPRKEVYSSHARGSGRANPSRVIRSVRHFMRCSTSIVPGRRRPTLPWAVVDALALAARILAINLPLVFGHVALPLRLPVLVEGHSDETRAAHVVLASHQQDE